MKKLVFIPFFLFLLSSCTSMKKSFETNGRQSDSIQTVLSDKILEANEAKMTEIEEISTSVNANHIMIVGSKKTNSVKHSNQVYTITPSIAPSVIPSTSISTGEVIYRIPKVMKVRDTYQVIVKIRKGKSIISVIKNDNGNVKMSVIPITETMEVKLIDPSPDDFKAFEIVADNDGVQIVDTTGEWTKWSWDVTPIKVGKANLKIMVSIIKNGNKKEEVYRDNVIVEANIGNQIKFFWHKYWQWSFTTLLIPIFKYFWGLWKKKKKDKPTRKSKRP